MTIPPYNALMLPILKLCAAKTWAMQELVIRVCDEFGLDQSEREAQIPSGGITVISNRVHWAKTYLKKAGLVEQPTRGHVSITKLGANALSKNPTIIDVDYLRRYEGFASFFPKRNMAGVDASAATKSIVEIEPVVDPSSTPEEQISSASLALEETLRDALLARILEGTPAFFERLIVDLLLSMGYGGSRADAGEQLGGTGDGGVDGVIREDQLGLDRVYLQAKRYQPANTIGSEAVHAFMGALLSKGAQKGVFITTSGFSKAAVQVAQQPGHLRLVLINGNELTKLMVRFGVGVRVARTVEIKRIDLDYFEEADPE